MVFVPDHTVNFSFSTSGDHVQQGSLARSYWIVVPKVCTFKDRKYLNATIDSNTFFHLSLSFSDIPQSFDASQCLMSRIPFFSVYLCLFSSKSFISLFFISRAHCLIHLSCFLLPGFLYLTFSLCFFVVDGNRMAKLKKIQLSSFQTRPKYYRVWPIE